MQNKLDELKLIENLFSVNVNSEYVVVKYSYTECPNG